MTPPALPLGTRPLIGDRVQILNADPSADGDDLLGTCVESAAHEVVVVLDLEDRCRIAAPFCGVLVLEQSLQRHSNPERPHG
ncbi:MAG TPA: hypothetical protein PK095_16380 [Myxococcota bacterium]|nr:hypothetical protein [Myxococcota bacterium]